MKEFGYSAGYQHAHKNQDAVTAMDCLPESLSQFVFYEPAERGFEKQLSERLRWLKDRKDKLKSGESKANFGQDSTNNTK